MGESVNFASRSIPAGDHCRLPFYPVPGLLSVTPHWAFPFLECS